MDNLRAVIVAPRYADSDLRVRRTIAVMANAFARVDVFWARQHPGHRFFERENDSRASAHYVEGRRLWLLRSIFGMRALGRAATEAIQTADIVYVHASGIEGLVYARDARRSDANPTIVFDYRDSLSFELFYQLKKRKLEALFGFSWMIYKLPIRWYARALDAVVGISAIQVEDLNRLARRSFDTVVIPNVREFDYVGDPRLPANEFDEISLVWVGQVMRGRDLEQVADWTKRLRREVRLHVFGIVLDGGVEADVREAMGDKVVFHGRFQSDEAIASALPSKTVGVFLGWDDPSNTGINRIASPNKYFTYMNLELPVILDASLEGLSREIDEWHAGLTIQNYSEFAAAIEDMRIDYSKYVAGMRKLKAVYWALPPERVLHDFLLNISRRSQTRRND